MGPDTLAVLALSWAHRVADGIKRWVGLGVIADNLISPDRLLDVEVAPA